VVVSNWLPKSSVPPPELETKTTGCRGCCVPLSGTDARAAVAIIREDECRLAQAYRPRLREKTTLTEAILAWRKDKCPDRSAKRGRNRRRLAHNRQTEIWTGQWSHLDR